MRPDRVLVWDVLLQAQVLAGAGRRGCRRVSPGGGAEPVRAPTFPWTTVPPRVLTAAGRRLIWPLVLGDKRHNAATFNALNV